VIVVGGRAHVTTSAIRLTQATEDPRPKVRRL
jgi:hypothetical protein